MRFKVFGPFQISRSPNGLIAFSAQEKKAFWARLEEEEGGLADGCGCYVVAAAGGNGTLPHYVGRTTARSFRVECSAHHVINHLNEVISGKPKLRPQLFLVAKLTPTGRLAKPSKSGHADIRFLENYMIGLALDRNANLRNQKQTKYLKDLHVEGFLNTKQGKPSPSASAFRKLLGRKDIKR